MFREEQARARIGMEEVARSLPAETAIVAYVHYNRHNVGYKIASPADTKRKKEEKPRQEQSRGKPSEPIPSYMSCVLLAG